MSSSRNETYGIMFGITLPIWGAKNRARVDEAKAKLEAAKAELDNQSNSAKAAADKLYWQVKNQERLFMLYRDTLLPDAKKAAELAQTWYEQKQTDFSQLLETRLVVGNFELAAARAEADYLNSLADIARLAGAPVISSDESNSEAQQVPDEEVSK